MASRKIEKNSKKPEVPRIGDTWADLFGVLDRLRMDLERELFWMIDRQSTIEAGERLASMTDRVRAEFTSRCVRILVDPDRLQGGRDLSDVCLFATAMAFCEMTHDLSFEDAMMCYGPDEDDSDDGPYIDGVEC